VGDKKSKTSEPKPHCYESWEKDDEKDPQEGEVGWREQGEKNISQVRRKEKKRRWQQAIIVGG